MATYRNLKRNLRMNIRPYNESDRAMPGLVSRLAVALIVLILAFSTPVFALTLSNNIILRIGDGYSFDMSRTNILKTVDSTLTPKDVSSDISSFMFHRQDALSLTSKATGDVRNFFTSGDTSAMSTVRGALDRTIPYGCVAFALIILCFALLFRLERYPHIRGAFITGSGLGIAALGLGAFAIFDQGLSGKVWAGWLDIKLTAVDRLPALFGRGVFVTELIATAAVTIAIILILGSVIFAITRDRRRIF